MTGEKTVRLNEIKENWSYYVQSPTQLAYSRLAKFPPGCENRLVDAISLQTGEAVLDIGSGLGILSGRLAQSGRPAQVIGCELNEAYIHASIPEQLLPEPRARMVQGSGFEIPLATNSVDRVLSHAIVTLMGEEELNRLHDEICRVLVPGGAVAHMDNINNEFWYPEELHRTEEERQRYDRFNELLEESHRRLGSGYGHTAYDLPGQLENLGAVSVTTDTYSWTLDLYDPRWDDQQKQSMQELWVQSRQDRITRARRLWEARGNLTPERQELLEARAEDVRRLARRRREALEQNRNPGWYSSTTLVSTGVFQSAGR